MKIGKSVWLASRISEANAEIAEYAEPIEIITQFNYFTVMPQISRGGMAMFGFGETYYDGWTAIANANIFSGKIKSGDLMWVDGEKPVEHIDKTYGNGASANAEVKHVAEVNISINIFLERNQKQVLE